MPSEKIEAWKQDLPVIDDAEAVELLSDPGAIWYDARAMPPAYQIGKPGRSDNDPVVFSDPEYNISGDRLEAIKGNGNGGNANIEFPWNTPGGLHLARNIEKVTVLVLPMSANGRRWPIITGPRSVVHPSGEVFHPLGWVFPVDTNFLEILAMNRGGRRHVFEIRRRTRERDDWGVDILRPTPTADSLVKRIKQLRPDWFRDRKLSRKLARIESPLTVCRGRLSDFKHDHRAFDVVGGEDVLPDLDERLVTEILQTTPFVSALGDVWKTSSSGVQCHAPTTDADFHIVPAGYQGTYLGSDRESCILCHRDTLKPAAHFQPDRGWYGLVRGSDGILSFHPVDPSSIDGNGLRDLSVQLRPEFVRSGVVEPMTQRRRPASIYTGIKNLK